MHPRVLDAKWSKIWKLHPPQNAQKVSKGPWYQLSMFPYPSGRLHIGHLRVYSISDVLARFRRMLGFQVIHPMGWDAFGLPAENAARDRHVSPSKWTYANIDTMRSQLQDMSTSFDWQREVVTCNPDYYKHTQRLFLKLLKRGLAYRAKAMVNWDSVDKTVLANEQVDSQGRSWRSGALVEQRELEQWFIKTTAYASELLEGLSILNDWPESVKSQQRHWIGKSDGFEINFGNDLWVYTTRPETLAGVAYLAVGHDFDRPLPSEGRNPLTGEVVPILTADYVVSGHGTGIVMGVPAHDERDYEFWKASQNNLGDIVSVYEGCEHFPYTDTTLDFNDLSRLKGLSLDEARCRILDILGPHNARKANAWRLHDWLISRQRYWGAPIPIVHCPSCGIVPVPESDLPVFLPPQKGEVKPLSHAKEWLSTPCPSCNGPAQRDPDTMDTFMDSSWYYFRYLDPKNPKEPFSRESTKGLMPVHMYVGGVEHAILHLLFSRFIARFCADEGMWTPSSLDGEPFARLVTQGMVHGQTFVDEATGRFLKRDEVDEEGRIKATNKMAKVTMEKMSKSKHNGVDPGNIIEKHGADATRALILYAAPPSDVLEWDEQKIVGMKRWLTRVQTLVSSLNIDTLESKVTNKEKRIWNDSIVPLSNHVTSVLLEASLLNTFISDLMKFTRACQALASDRSALTIPATKVLLKLLAPVAPANAEEAWEILSKKQGYEWNSIFAESWPKLDSFPIDSDDTIALKLSVNGRFLKMVEVSKGLDEAEALKLVNASQYGTLKRVIYRPERGILSLVVIKCI